MIVGFGFVPDCVVCVAMFVVCLLCDVRYGMCCFVCGCVFGVCENLCC